MLLLLPHAYVNVGVCLSVCVCVPACADVSLYGDFGYGGYKTNQILFFGYQFAICKLNSL